MISERFVFGIPLIARTVAADWERVSWLLGLTVRSVLAQSDPTYEVMLAAHDLPESWSRLAGDDPRFRVLRADWRPEAPTARNDDAGMKKWRIKDAVARSGGGLLMYLDADDLVDCRLVAAARVGIGREQVGGIVEEGLIIDIASGRAARLPDPAIYEGGFHELCGSSTVGRIDPESRDEVRRDPFEVLGSHHQWPQNAARLDVRLSRLPVIGAYLVGTAQNHSELHGPYSAWRRELNRAVAAAGRPLAPDAAAQFGLLPEHLIPPEGR